MTKLNFSLVMFNPPRQTGDLEAPVKGGKMIISQHLVDTGRYGQDKGRNSFTVSMRLSDKTTNLAIRHEYLVDAINSAQSWYEKLCKNGDLFDG